jgi:hypothetical protein
MKSILILLLVIPFIGIGQLDFEEKSEPKKIGELIIGGALYGKTVYFEDSDSYVLFYRNIKYSKITDIKNFTIGDKKDFDSLYSTIMDNTSENIKKNLELTLTDGEKVRLEFDKKHVQIWHYNGTAWGSSGFFKQKHVNKLFGK